MVDQCLLFALFDTIGATNPGDAQPWFASVGRDGRPYPLHEHILFFSGCFMWVVAYLIMMANARKHRFFEMAAFAGASNFAWELVWGLHFRTDMGMALVWCYKAWFIIDLGLIAMLWAWGHKQVAHPALRRHFRPLLAATVVFFTAAYFSFVTEGLDTTIGARSAYVCQVILSACCLLLLARVPSIAGFSSVAGVLRCVGTGLVTVFMFLHYPDYALVLMLASTATILDLCYLLLFWQRWRRGETGGEAGIPEEATIDAYMQGRPVV